jgi:hypothetical protein
MKDSPGYVSAPASAERRSHVSYASYRLPPKVVKQERPRGVAILSVLGILSSLLYSAGSLSLLLMWERLHLPIARPTAGLIAGLAVGIVTLWINWGLWEMVRWAWWINLALYVLGAVSIVFALRYAPAFVASIAKARLELGERQLLTSTITGLVVNLIYCLVAALYLLGVRQVFGIGLKDERPLWERVNRF